MSDFNFGCRPLLTASVAATVVNVGLRTTRVCWIQAVNNNLTDVYLQLFDAVAANVTLGTTVPTLSILLKGGSGASNQGAFDLSFPVPLRFTTGLSMAVTTTPLGLTAGGVASLVNIGLL